MAEAHEEDVSKHMGKYYAVFVALLCLTAITVAPPWTPQLLTIAASERR